MTITGDRARVLDFSSPYFNAVQALVVRAGLRRERRWRTSAAGRSRVQAGTTGELYVTDNAPEDTEIVTFEDSADDRCRAREGRAWTRLSTTTPWSATCVADNPGFEVAAEFDTGEQYGMAVKKNGNVDLLRTINDVLADLRPTAGTTRSTRSGSAAPPPRDTARQCASVGGAGQTAYVVDRVGLVGGLVVAVADHPREAQRQAAGVAARALQPVEGDLDDLLRADVDDPVVALASSAPVNRSVCQVSISSVMPLKVLPSITNPPSGSRAPRWMLESQPFRRPEPSSTASTTRSSVCTASP